MQPSLASHCLASTLAVSLLACSRNKQDQHETKSVPSTTSIAVLVSAAGAAGAAPMTSTSVAGAAFGAEPQYTVPAGKAATFCSDLPKLQRRILAAAWLRLEGPTLFSTEEITTDVREYTRAQPPAFATTTPASHVAGGGAANSSELGAAGVPATSRRLKVPSGDAQGAAHVSGSSDAGTNTNRTSTNPTNGGASSDEIDIAALDSAPDLPQVPAMLGQCWPTRNGAWTMFLDDVDRNENDLEGTWAIGHVDRKGRLLAAKLMVFGYTNPSATADELVVADGARGDYSLVDANEERFYAAGNAFDWDGDGESELLVTASLTKLHRTQTMGRIWTFRAGTIRLYAPTRQWNVMGVKDIDHDGRPDLEIYVGGGLFASPSSAKWMGCDSLNLVAHSLPDGKFTFRDSTAIEFAKSICKKPGKELSTQVEVLCARVWGMNSDAITRGIQRGCRNASPGTECEDIDTLHDLATTAVPVVIPKSERE